MQVRKSTSNKTIRKLYKEKMIALAFRCKKRSECKKAELRYEKAVALLKHTYHRLYSEIPAFAYHRIYEGSDS